MHRLPRALSHLSNLCLQRNYQLIRHRVRAFPPYHVTQVTSKLADIIWRWEGLPERTATTQVPHVPSPPQLPVWNGESNRDVRSSYILMFWLLSAVRRFAPKPDSTVKLPASSPAQSSGKLWICYWFQLLSSKQWFISLVNIPDSRI